MRLNRHSTRISLAAIRIAQAKYVILQEIRMRQFRALTVLVAATAAWTSQANAEAVVGLSGSTIVSFDSATPGTINSSVPITGLPGGVTLTGIDFRPADGQLYSVSSTGNVYVLALNGAGTSYAATSLGMISTAPSGSSFGLDFNPTVDRLRFVSDANQNLRINPNTMPPGTIVDGALTLNGSSSIDLIGAAYTNSFAGATTTTLYGIDAFTDALVRSTGANAGTYTNTNLSGDLFASLGFDLLSTDLLGFDISGSTGAGFFSVGDNFYGINLNTGTATLVGSLGARGITGISVVPVPEPGTWAMMLLGFGAVGFAMRRKNRSGLIHARA
jgi:hypothetical protein